MVDEQFAGVNFGYRIDRDIWRLVFKSTMNVHVAVHRPTRMSETLNCLELVPLGGLGVVDFEGDIFSNLVCTSADDHHQGAEEESGMLVARSRHLP